MHINTCVHYTVYELFVNRWEHDVSLKEDNKCEALSLSCSLSHTRTPQVMFVVSLIQTFRIMTGVICPDIGWQIIGSPTTHFCLWSWLRLLYMYVLYFYYPGQNNWRGTWTGSLCSSCSGFSLRGKYLLDDLGHITFILRSHIHVHNGMTVVLRLYYEFVPLLDVWSDRTTYFDDHIVLRFIVAS